MTAVVPAKEFRAAAAFVARAADRKSKIKILATTKLATVDGALELAATNLDHVASVRVPASGKTEPVCIDARRLAAIAATLDGEVSIDSLSLAANGTRYEFPGLYKAEDFPDACSGLNWSDPILPAPEFRRGLARAAFAMSREETRYYLNGIQFKPGRAAATDGHRLVTVPLNGNGAKFDPIIVPKGAVALANVMPRATASEVRQAGLNLLAKEGDYQLATRLIDGSFPEIDRVIPGEDKMRWRFTVNSADLRLALRRLSPLCEKGKWGSGTPIRFSAKGVTLTLSVQHHEFGTGHEQIECEEMIGEPVEFGANYRYVGDLCAGTEQLHWGVEDKASPMRITPGDGRLFVLMPMRV